MLRLIASVRITVVCLFLLFILTFWGTMAQVQQGLYAAQERFFASFFFLAGGWFPFPGAQLVLWILFVNLIAALIVHFQKQHGWASIGGKVTHLGLILYFAAAFFIFHLSQESYVHLGVGEQTNVSTSYTEWELAYWQSTQAGHRRVTAVDSKNFKPGEKITFNASHFTMSVERYYPNCEAFDNGGKPQPAGTIGLDNISRFVLEPLHKEREKDLAGGIFNLTFDGKPHTLLLFGAEARPTPVSIDGKDYFFILRHKTFPLPFVLRLDRFKAAFHPDTDMAKSFQSWVTISTGSLTRRVRIHMNSPLRYKDYTLYQASYDTDAQGRQYSTLAVVRNSARLMPYISCLVVFIGLALHFLIQALMAKARL
ncbi:MAG: cytochrome c biogenesis protein ResB [Candidatus Omnitrophica bacterium]|nr:cytochrome c biogenesis protein ResB [Candidatus Omnitrophota bacterium]MDE2008673.1 cytochrome c biogenesis protein ResB [Candidatus Omnitrophota bacterium]MDE2214814.1 cytochrome c biogenesis protein ResB [Candidatus Omnitrophota bacterium]MDE2230883.1 cytochrome c biogenesis protein ResB [Candidatus Omnitrophota bacterium]